MIELSDIHKSYGPVEVLRGVSLQVHPGEVMTIVGPSGAGKSTLLQIMGTLETPDRGDIVYTLPGSGPTRVLSLGDKELSRFRNRSIGFVFQMHRLLPEFTLAENVAMPALIGGASQAEATARAVELLDYIGLGDRKNHRPSEVSGGEAQRAAVARALVNRPPIVFADEPSGSLDSANRRRLHGLFFDLRRDFGTAFVIVTHDESLAADSDRTIHLRDGRIES
ncbi:MAG: ABC transporter ATP-binding protein [Muribaculaceae bacterium]